MTPSLKIRITLAIRVLLEGHRLRAWGKYDWARIDDIREENARLKHDNIVGAAVGIGRRRNEKTDTLVLKVYVVKKEPLGVLATDQRIPRVLVLPQPIGEIEAARLQRPCRAGVQCPCFWISGNGS